MKIIETPLAGLAIIEPKKFIDTRGFFLESFQERNYQKLLNVNFVQDNLSHSKKNVLRGLHYQVQQPQAKLVSVIKGCVFDVAVDIRKKSTTFGKWFGIILDDKNHRQLFIPKGFAHGFYVLSETADFHYKCSNYYNPATELGILWSDSNLSITWPKNNDVLLSEKDKLLPTLENIPQEHLFND
ncbi:MAG: dTDP-4-dehydrorhamnose 3,5-epimerase [Rickettsiella sp.]|nr:dTDP-4-dehydrorhamnose 3,5-epimerase [Rickettsiella sp.]